jgi:hypothetical protein
MSLSLGSINGDRYISDAKRMLVDFLRYYLEADHVATFTKWVTVDLPCGVIVYASDPNVQPAAAWNAPHVSLALQGDVVDSTLANSGERQHDAEWHRVNFEVTCETDEATGGRLLCDDLAAAAQKCFVDHRNDLTAAGLNVLSREGALADTDNEIRVWRNKLQVKCDVLVMGRVLRTVEVPLGTWTFSAMGQGDFAHGLDLQTPHVLRAKLLTGTGYQPTTLTVHALNQAGVDSTLMGTIPGSRSSGTYIALAPANPGDEFTSVTSITVSPSSGLPGETFEIVNIPQEA